MPRLQSLETPLQQLNLPDISSAFNYLADDTAHWQNEIDRFMSIKPPRAPATTPLHTRTPTSAQATVHSMTSPEADTFLTPIDPTHCAHPAQKTLPPTPQPNPQPQPPTSCPPPAPTYPASIPKTTPTKWIVHIPCSIPFSPCTPRATWPWPNWVCDAFETGDVQWCTLGSEAKAHVNIRARRGDLLEFFERVERDKGMKDLWFENERSEMEIVELSATVKLEAEKLSAKWKAQGVNCIEVNKKMQRVVEGKKGLAKGVLVQLEAMQMEAEKLRVRMRAQWDEGREEGMEDWELLDGEFAEEGWVDVSHELMIREGWARILRTVRSGGEWEGEGA